MKHYPKIHEDILAKWDIYEKYAGSATGSIDDLVLRFRTFYHRVHREIFYQSVVELWLELQFMASGKRKKRRTANGIFTDLLFAKFMQFKVGISQRTITATAIFGPVSTYMIEFFPDFLLDDPVQNPEKYAYPYEHVTLDFLFFAHQMDERLELLAEAEKKRMTYAVFVNYVVNWALCYNLEKNVEKYELAFGDADWPIIRNKFIKRGWEHKKFLFETTCKK